NLHPTFTLGAPRQNGSRQIARAGPVDGHTNTIRTMRRAEADAARGSVFRGACSVSGVTRADSRESPVSWGELCGGRPADARRPGTGPADPQKADAQGRSIPTGARVRSGRRPSPLLQH